VPWEPPVEHIIIARSDCVNDTQSLGYPTCNYWMFARLRAASASLHQSQKAAKAVTDTSIIKFRPESAHRNGVQNRSTVNHRDSGKP
jgi:hypothetical protein